MMNLNDQPCPQCKQSDGLSIESSRELEISRIGCSECGYDFFGHCCEEDLINKFSDSLVTETIKATALASGFKLKQQPNGDMDLNPYVYNFAKALMATIPDAPQSKSSRPSVSSLISVYQLSTDYKKLYQLVDAGEVVAAFAERKRSNSDVLVTDICRVIKHRSFNISFGVCGISYDEIFPFDSEDGTEEEVFIAACEGLNLGWIEP